MKKESKIFGIELIVKPKTELIKLIISKIKESKKNKFCYLDANHINLALKDKKYLDILNKNTINYPAGVGIILASKILFKNPIYENTSTLNIIDNIFYECQKNNWSIYLLGAKKEIVKKAVLNIKYKYPQINISGFHHGYFENSEEIIKDINNKQPKILFVSMGPPKQEIWVNNNFKQLNVDNIWFVGALFDVLSKQHPRAPLWIQNIWMEWLYRLILEPKRLWKRYLIGNIIFLFNILKQKFK